MRTKKVKVFRRVQKLLCKSGFWCMINRKAHTEAKARKTGGADVPAWEEREYGRSRKNVSY